MDNWNDVDNNYMCPICTASTVPISGTGELMILGDAPDAKDVVRGLAWQGRDGGILRTELQKLYIDMYTCKLGNLWLHPPNENEECLQHSDDTTYIKPIQ